MSEPVEPTETTETKETSAPKASSYWPEIRKVAETKRYELILVGSEISKRIEDQGGHLDSNLYKLTHLNLLEVAKTKLAILPRQISQIENLTSLLFHSNELTTIPPEIGKLANLKNLDFSNNKLTTLPDELKNLKELMTINFGGNQLETLFPLDEMSKLAVLDLSRNKFKTLLETTTDLTKLENLSCINASFNELVELSENLVDLPSIKTLNFENNQLIQVPANLCQCLKLKELLLKSNKLKDNRLKKLVESDKVNLKSVIDYLERIYIEESKNKAKAGGSAKAKAGAKPKGGANKETANVIVEYDLIKVVHFKHDKLNSIELIYTESVQDSRPFILCAILRQLDLKTPGNLKKFLNIQVNYRFF